MLSTLNFLFTAAVLVASLRFRGKYSDNRTIVSITNARKQMLCYNFFPLTISYLQLVRMMQIETDADSTCSLLVIIWRLYELIAVHYLGSITDWYLILMFHDIRFRPLFVNCHELPLAEETWYGLGGTSFCRQKGSISCQLAVTNVLTWRQV